MKVAQHEVLGNDAKKHIRPVRDDSKVWLWFRMPLSDCQHWSIAPSGTDSSFKNANPVPPRRMLSCFRVVPAGLILSNHQQRS
jgi:hypothetical protein